MVYRDESVITQINDGASLSFPTVSPSPESTPPRQSVNYTGGNTALLAHRLGSEHITSIEIDPHLSAHARTALTDARYGAVTVLTGDGTVGHPRRASPVPRTPDLRWLRPAGSQLVRQLNESPQAQEPPALGLSIVKPCFSMVSRKSITAPCR